MGRAVYPPGPSMGESMVHRCTDEVLNVEKLRAKDIGNVLAWTDRDCDNPAGLCHERPSDWARSRNESGKVARELATVTQRPHLLPRTSKRSVLTTRVRATQVGQAGFRFLVLYLQPDTLFLLLGRCAPLCGAARRSAGS